MRILAKKFNKIFRILQTDTISNTLYHTAVVLPQFATTNHAVTLSLLPPPRWDGEENQKEKGNTLGLG